MYTASTVDTQQNKPKPAFTVKKLSGNVEREIVTFNKDKRCIERKTVEEPAGFEVRTMRGDVVRLRDVKELNYYGMGGHIPLIEESIAAAVGVIENPVAKGAK